MLRAYAWSAHPPVGPHPNPLPKGEGAKPLGPSRPPSRPSRLSLSPSRLRLYLLRLRRLWLHLCRRWRRWRGVVRVPSLSSPLGRRAVGRRAGGLSGGHPCGRGLLLVPLVVERLELFGLLGLLGGEVF